MQMVLGPPPIWTNPFLSLCFRPLEVGWVMSPYHVDNLPQLTPFGLGLPPIGLPPFGLTPFGLPSFGLPPFGLTPIGLTK